ncbi:Basement membrane-specific heparan sulfate proteoglycan core protein [Fasciola gigantica]|uniref:Basement membrane-specific heparan sulfate proteoglycan core protein n=1 Tax=Fasciola gigantica TaxID=46835 RepID=A0A504YXJ7_FASGI|nr:Basement membrane-specific heparan sulfate proteoglycan core protein [Fasciola gigantica]
MYAGNRCICILNSRPSTVASSNPQICEENDRPPGRTNELDLFTLSLEPDPEILFTQIARLGSFGWLDRRQFEQMWMACLELLAGANEEEPNEGVWSTTAQAKTPVSEFNAAEAVRVQPGHRVRLECRTDVPGTRPTVRFADGRPISEDTRFVITRPNTETIVIEVPYGFDAATRRVVLTCESPTGDSKASVIYVDQSCQIGQRRCPGGDCIFVGQFCDGIEHCPDGYDERPENCAICDPISIPCQAVNGQEPIITHFQLHWLCDGDNDCGNGFDELNCRNDTRNLDPNCGSTHFQCTSAPHQHIPFAYWCDGTIDCPGGEDEQDCARPAIVDSGHREPYKVRPGDTLILECEASGVPPPMIIWRFNWGCLPDVSRARIEVVPGRSHCRGSRSRLTITGFRPGDDGIYNCEALAYSHRAMSQDILVLLND